MWTFNLVITTAAGGRYRALLEELAPLGEFRPTEFFGVILGQVESPELFLQTVQSRRQERLIDFQDLGRAVPVMQIFTFRPETLAAEVEAAIRPRLPQLAGAKFYVRLERRGMKGRIVSPEIERELDRFVLGELEKEGQTAQVDFEDPDLIIAVETVGDRGGVGLLDRELRNSYEFVRVG